MDAPNPQLGTTEEEMKQLTREITTRTIADIQRMEEALKTQTAAELIDKLKQEQEPEQSENADLNNQRIQTIINYIRFVDENAQLMKKATIQLENDKDFIFTPKQFKRWKKTNNVSPEDEALALKEDGGELLLYKLTQLWDYVIEWNMQQIPQPNFLGALEYIVCLNDRLQAVRSIQKELFDLSKALTLKIKKYKELTNLSTSPVSAADIMVDVYNQSSTEDFNELKSYVYCFSVLGSYTEFHRLYKAISNPGPLYEHSSGKRCLWKGIIDIIQKTFICHLVTLIPKSRAIAEHLLRDFDTYLRSNVHRLTPNGPPAPIPPPSVVRPVPSKRNRWAKHRDIQKQVTQVVVNFEKMMQNQNMTTMVPSREEKVFHTEGGFDLNSYCPPPPSPEPEYHIPSAFNPQMYFMKPDGTMGDIPEAIRNVKGLPRNTPINKQRDFLLELFPEMRDKILRTMPTDEELAELGLLPDAETSESKL